MIDKIVSIYKADTSQHKAAIKELSGEQKKLAQEQLKGLEQQNDKLEGYIKSFGKATVAVGALAVAGKLLWEGWEHNARKAQLATNVQIADVEKLRKGFGGLRTEMESLELANKLSHASFKLSGTQMETVGRAIRQLVREGATWEDATDKVTEAVVKLEGDALKPFGIRLRESKTDGEKFAAVMDALTEKSSKLGSTSRTSAEDLAGMKSRFGDAMDGVKTGLGDIAKAFAPVIEQLATVVGFVGKIASVLGEAGILGKIASAASYLNPVKQLGWVAGKVWDYGNSGGESYGARTPSGPMSRAGFNDPFAFSGFRDTSNVSLPDAYSGWNTADLLSGGFADVNMLAYLATGKAGDWLGKVAGKNQKNTDAGKRAKAMRDAMWKQATLDIVESAAPRGGLDDYEVSPWSFTDRPDMTIGSQPTIDLNALKKYGPGGVFDAQAYGQYNADKSASKLESMFGPIEEFDAYKSAFEGLTTVVQSAFDAWITGSMSVGEAIKRMVGEVLRANAVQLLGEAIKHGVYAIGSLAFGDFRGAAQHGTAAAKAAAGAVALGALAKGLGAGSSGGGGGGGGSASAAPTTSGAGAGSGGGNTYVVTYGDSFAGDSPLQRSRNARRMVETALGSPGVK